MSILRTIGIDISKDWLDVFAAPEGRASRFSTRILRWGPFGAVFCGASAEWMEKGRGSGRYQALGVTAVLQ